MSLSTSPSQQRAIGPIGTIARVASGLGLIYLASVRSPRLSRVNGIEKSAAPMAKFRQGAALFIGASLLLAAVRGYAGCEITAISNWLLQRDDQVGCVVFSPIDEVEKALTRKIATS